MVWYRSPSRSLVTSKPFVSLQKLAGSVCAAMLQQKELTFRWARGAAALLAPNATVDAQLLGGAPDTKRLLKGEKLHPC